MPDNPLEGWSEWGTPFKSLDLIDEINTGFTNENYLIKADGQLCVLRINAQNSKALGIDRERERLILELASAEELAPNVMFFSAEHGVLISEFIDGQHWHSPELEDAEKMSLLIDSMKKIHLLQVTTSPFNYYEHAENYWQQLLDRNINIPEELHQKREWLMPQFSNISVSNIICHHDPNPENIIFKSGKLFFLDWEYAAPGWPVFDFAALSVEWNIPVSELIVHHEIDVNEIIQASELYRYLCDLWLVLQTKN